MPFPSSAPATCALVLDSERNIDTKSGGEAGMAGVGRRGFAAAARAAMFASSLPHHDPSQNKNTSLAMDGRRANAPQYLDINAAMSHVMRGELLLFSIMHFLHIFLHSICIINFPAQ